jgi:elongation factor G
VPEGPAGDIVAIVGLRESVTGDTLCEAHHPILLEPIVFAETVVSQKVEPDSSADKQKLLDTLTLLRREDPTFTWKTDPETGQTLISGMGTLHLEVKKHRLERDFRLKVRVGKPLVSYRETLRRPIKVVGECDRQIGQNRQFARVTVEFTNAKSDAPVTVIRRLGETAVPEAFLAAAERGVRDGLTSGVIGGFPLLHVQAAITGAELDPATSSEVAFQAAGMDAVNRAQSDNMVLLEPIMRLKVEVPEEFFGAVAGDLNARRAEILDTALRGKWRVIDAMVPLARMFDYTERVRSLTQGRASPSMEPFSYEPAPDDVVRSFTHPDEF